MQQLPNEAGNATRVITAGVTVLSTSNASLLGVLCCNSATAGTAQIFAGLTATATSASGSGGAIITGVITFLSGRATFLRVPAYASGGLLVNVGTADNPDLTFYWNPVGAGF